MTTEIRCSINMPAPVAQCTDQESTRYALTHALVCPGTATDKDVHVVASDSRILAIVKCEGETQAPAMMPAAVGKYAGPRVLNGRWELETGSKRSRKIVVGDDYSADNPDAGRFPRADQILPQAVDSADFPFYVTLDARLLANLATALVNEESRGLTIFFPAPDQRSGRVEAAMIVSGSHGIGAIMPLAPDHPTGEADRAAYRDKATIALPVVKAGVEGWNEAVHAASVAREKARKEAQG